MTIGAILGTVTGYLREKGSTTPRLDAELLLAQALGSTVSSCIPNTIARWTRTSSTTTAGWSAVGDGLSGRLHPRARSLRRLILEVTAGRARSSAGDGGTGRGRSRDPAREAAWEALPGAPTSSTPVARTGPRARDLCLCDLGRRDQPRSVAGDRDVGTGSGAIA